jgi:hypothetical protein
VEHGVEPGADCEPFWFRRHDSLIPTLWAISRTGRSRSRANSTARARSSGGLNRPGVSGDL